MEAFQVRDILGKSKLIDPILITTDYIQSLEPNPTGTFSGNICTPLWGSKSPESLGKKLSLAAGVNSPYIAGSTEYTNGHFIVASILCIAWLLVC